MHKEQAVRVVQEDLGNNPSLVAACLAVIDYLSGQPRGNLEYITFDALTKAAQLSDQMDVIPVIRYLAGSSVPLLDPQFEFIEGTVVEPVEQEDIVRARDTGIFYHPITGEKVEQFESKIFMHFTLSPEGRGLHGDVR